MVGLSLLSLSGSEEAGDPTELLSVSSDLPSGAWQEQQLVSATHRHTGATATAANGNSISHIKFAQIRASKHVPARSRRTSFVLYVLLVIMKKVPISTHIYMYLQNDFKKCLI